MDLPPFIKYFPFMFKIGSFYNIHTGEYKNGLVILRLFTNVGLFMSTVWCMVENEFQCNSLEKLHDLLGLFLFISSDLVLIGCKGQMSLLAQLLEEPFDFWELGSPHALEFERYMKDVQINGSITFLYIILCCICWATMPLWYIFGFVLDPSEKQFHLLLGWIPCSVESYYAIVGLYIGSVFLCLMDLGVFFSWFLAMIFCVLKIKFKLRILRVELETLDQRAKQLMRRNLKSLLSRGTLTSCLQCRKPFRKLVAGDKRIQTNGRERQWFHGISRATGCCEESARNTILQECYNYHIKNAAIQHQDIIRVVALVDKCFKPLIMVFSQLGVIIMALATPKLGSLTNMNTTEYIKTGLEIFGGLSVIAVFNYFGQIVLNESYALQQALYGSNWVSKPWSFKRSLFMMQTMATKPLRLTVGGIYILSMETYTSIITAFYSYASLLQSQRNDSA